MKKSKICVSILFILLVTVITFAFVPFNSGLVKAENSDTYPLYTDNIAFSEEVYLGGIPLGISIKTDGLIVVGLTDVITADGAKMPSRNGDIFVGDIIVSACGKSVHSLQELKSVIVDGKPVNLALKRGGTLRTVSVCPLLDKLTNNYKIGIMVKEEVNGIGTLSFITSDKRYGALGHRITDGESGLSFELNHGQIFEATITGVIKGEKGKAGGLKGGFSKLATSVGTIDGNTSFGIFGTFEGKHKLKKVEVAHKSQVRMGKAQIYTTINSTTPQFYDIEIIKCTQQNSLSEKGIVFNVTDSRLLEATGGIVQGMSGSPIVQNGKLVGAVTHVFINDPTRGYGIYASFMLDKSRNSK